MHCENCGTKMTVITGELDTYNYCFCCGNVQEISEIALSNNTCSMVGLTC